MFRGPGLEINHIHTFYPVAVHQGEAAMQMMVVAVLWEEDDVTATFLQTLVRGRVGHSDETLMCSPMAFRRLSLPARPARRPTTYVVPLYDTNPFALSHVFRSTHSPLFTTDR